MLLSARPLKDVATVNSFEVDSSVDWTEGDTLTLYFQLIDASLDVSSQGFNPAGRRFCPPATSTLTVTLENIDDARKLVRTASQPFPEDLSIWSIPILVTDKVRGTPQMRLTLTMPGAKVVYGVVKNLFRVQSATNLC